MWICKVCLTANKEESVCKRCGFDPSMDYEEYPTPVSFDCSNRKSVSGLTEGFLNTVDPAVYLCEDCGCSRYYYSKDSGKLICCECGREIRLELLKAEANYSLPAGDDNESESADAPQARIEACLIKPVPVSIGFNHVVGVRKDGSVVAAGNNINRQCEVNDFHDVIAVSAGFLNTLGLKRDGTVVSLGFSAGEADAICSWNDIVAVAAGKGFGAGLRSDGTVSLSTNSLEYLKEAEAWGDIVSITASGTSLFGVRADGRVLSCQNTSQARIAASISGWKEIASIAATDSCVFGLRRSGTVLSAVRMPGTVAAKSLGEVASWSGIRSISASSNHLVGLGEDGRVSVVGISGGSLLAARQAYTNNSPVGGLSFGMKAVTSWQDIKAVYAGETYTLGIKADGTVVIAGITTLDKQLSAWTDLLLPE